MDLSEQLRQAMIYDKGDEVARLLTSNPELVHWRDVANATPLHFASFWDRKSAVEAIVRCAPQLTTSTNFLDETPLHVASSAGSFDAMKALLAANPSAAFARNDAGLTFLEAARDVPFTYDIFATVAPLTSEVYFRTKRIEHGTPTMARS